ncbi:hypothetical protein PG987_006967 [Apiospora arundinis]
MAMITIVIPGDGGGNTKEEYQVSEAKLTDIYRKGDVKAELLANPDHVFVFPDHYHPKAVSLVINIINDPYNQNTPAVIGEELLYHLLKFTRALNITRITSPWAKGWAEGIELSVVRRASVTSARLFIAWELGDYVSFDGMVSWIARAMTKPEDGNILNALKDCVVDFAGIQIDIGEHFIKVLAGKSFVFLISNPVFEGNSNLVNSQLLEDIEYIRKLAIVKIYRAINKDMETLALRCQNAPGIDRLCRHGEDQDMCEMILSGSLHAELYKCKLWPPVLGRPHAKDSMCSVQQLRASIRETRENLSNLRDLVPKSKHPKCSKGLAIFTTLFHEVQELSVLSRGHFNDHFIEQGKRTGFVSVDPNIIEID